MLLASGAISVVQLHGCVQSLVGRIGSSQCLINIWACSSRTFLSVELPLIKIIYKYIFIGICKNQVHRAEERILLSVFSRIIL